jgi:hypothetical protein
MLALRKPITSTIERGFQIVHLMGAHLGQGRIYVVIYAKEVSWIKSLFHSGQAR